MSDKDQASLRSQATGIEVIVSEVQECDDLNTRLGAIYKRAIERYQQNVPVSKRRNSS